MHTQVVEQEKGWWFSQPEKRYNALDRTDVCVGFDDSVKAVQEQVQLLGPFDGLLGFSQGACLAALLCALQQTDKTSPFQFRFVILFAGFQSLLSQHTDLYCSLIRCPASIQLEKQMQSYLPSLVLTWRNDLKMLSLTSTTEDITFLLHRILGHLSESSWLHF